MTKYRLIIAIIACLLAISPIGISKARAEEIESNETEEITEPSSDFLVVEEIDDKKIILGVLYSALAMLGTSCGGLVIFKKIIHTGGKLLASKEALDKTNELSIKNYEQAKKEMKDATNELKNQLEESKLLNKVCTKLTDEIKTLEETIKLIVINNKDFVTNGIAKKVVELMESGVEDETNQDNKL